MKFSPFSHPLLLLVAVLASLLSHSASSADELVFCGQATDKEGRVARAVFSISADGTNRRQITSAGRIQSPSVSPLGRKLVYFRWPKLNVCNWDGSDDVCITPIPREHFQPAWSPDGKSIAFSTDRSEDAEIFLMDPDGANPRNLTWRGLSPEMSPAWSSDGEQIAFVSERGTYFDIFTMDRFGKNQRAVFAGGMNCHTPTWSPDGKQIAFAGERDGKFQIYMIAVDGSGLEQLTDDDSWNGQPAWSHDGSRLAFVSTRDGSSDIFEMELASCSVRNITRTPDEDEDFPSWAPKQISSTPPKIDSIEREGVAITAAKVEGASLARPRLLFRAEDLPGLRERLKTEPLAGAWQAFLKGCDGLVAPDSASMRDLMARLPEIDQAAAKARKPVEVARNLGFAYQVTGDPRYGKAGARLLEAVCERLRENHPLFAMSWESMSPDALPSAFDWLYTAMSEQQRRTVRGVLLNSTDTLYRFALNSPVGFSPVAEESETSSNMTLITTAYLGPSALALVGEPGARPEWLDAAVHMLENVSERWYDTNGATACGHSYFTWAGNMAVPFLMSCEANQLGNQIAAQNMRHWPTWWALTSRNDMSETINLGDSYAAPTVFNVAYLDLYCDNPLVDLLWDKSGAPKTPAPTVEDLLWWRAVKADPKAVEALPNVLFFPNSGMMVFRSGLGPDDPMMTFSSPRYGGHSHAEGGGFCLYGYGMDFAVEVGNGSPEPQAHNNVLINGRGRPFPWKVPDHDLIVPLPPTALGSIAKADLTETFSTRYDGHGHFPYASPGYPMRKAVRYAAMVHSKNDAVPPYFLIADDYDRDGKSNRYEFLLTGQRDNRIEVGDHQVVMRRMYRGPWFESASATPDDLIGFDAAIPVDGTYFVWVYIKGPKARYRLGVGGEDITGMAGVEATLEKSWQWQRLRTGDPGKETPLALPLKTGQVPLTLRHATERYGGNFARLLLTPSATFEPWDPDAAGAPDGSVLIKAEDAKFTGSAWLRHAADPKSSEPRCLFAFLNPEPLVLALSIYQYRTRHYGQKLNSLPRITATRDAVNPRFLVLAYPHRADMPQPKIERKRDGDTLTATIAWDKVVDTITWKPDSPPQIVRRGADGSTTALPAAE